MVEKEILVHTADGDMTTFVVHPDGDGPFPVAVVYMDGVGYREQVKENARRFAAGGYYCARRTCITGPGSGSRSTCRRWRRPAFRDPRPNG